MSAHRRRAALDRAGQAPDSLACPQANPGSPLASARLDRCRTAGRPGAVFRRPQQLPRAANNIEPCLGMSFKRSADGEELLEQRREGSVAEAGEARGNSLDLDHREAARDRPITLHREYNWCQPAGTWRRGALAYQPGQGPDVRRRRPAEHAFAGNGTGPWSGEAGSGGSDLAMTPQRGRVPGGPDGRQR